MDQDASDGSVVFLETFRSIYKSEFNDFNGYLSPNWDAIEASGISELDLLLNNLGRPGNDALAPNDISIVTAELACYATLHCRVFVESATGISEAQQTPTHDNEIYFKHLETVVEDHAQTNCNYCRRVIAWLISVQLPYIITNNTSSVEVSDSSTSAKSRATKIFTDLTLLFQEYLKFAPGLWREAVLIETLKSFILPQAAAWVCKATEPRVVKSSNKQQISPSSSALTTVDQPSTTAGSLSVGSHSHSQSHQTGSDFDGDEFSETQSMISDIQSMRSRTGSMGVTRINANAVSGGSNAKAIQKINKLKVEVSMLKEVIEKLNYTDVTMLEERVRGANADLAALRQRNTEFRERIQSLEATLFQLREDHRLSLNELETLKTREAMKKEDQGLLSRAGDDGDDSHRPLDSEVLKGLAGSERKKPRVVAMNNPMISQLEAKCDHFQKLSLAYERRIQVLEREEFNRRKKHTDIKKQRSEASDNKRSQQQKEEGEESIKASNRDSLHDLLATMTSQERFAIKKAINAAVKEQGLEQEKTIAGLAIELKRLTKLLPKDLSDDDRSERDASYEDQALPSPIESTTEEVTSKATEIDPRDIVNKYDDDQRVSKTASRSSNWLLPFLVGVLMTILSLSLFEWQEVGRMAAISLGYLVELVDRLVKATRR